MLSINAEKSKFLIFSDDIEESKKSFNIYESKFDIVYTDKMQSAIGLCTMSLCDHIICANSSFSYWAAMLNRNPNKKIICHNQYINHDKNPIGAKILNSKWYPKSWIALDS